MDKIKLFDTSKKLIFTEDAILAAIKNGVCSSNFNPEFSGRPTTKIIEFAGNIVKLKTEYRLPMEQAHNYVEKIIAREKVLQVHHPDKTWFLYIVDNDLKEQEVIIGNISPRLVTLSNFSGKFDQLEDNILVNLVGDIVSSYVRIAAKFDLTLDLCPSNFGIDNQYHCYYIDDDVYPWDSFASLPHFLAKLIRSLPCLNKAIVNSIGISTRASIIESFLDKHWVTVVAEELRASYFSLQCDNLKNILINALYDHQVFNYTSYDNSPIVALVSDIHANAPALEATLSYLQSRSIFSGIVLGDIVGYGPHPSQCIELLKSHQQWSIVCGNHDHAVACGIMPVGITPLAQWALNWTIENTNQSEKDWLDRLPPYIRQDNWLAVHGAPNDKSFFNAYVYQMTFTDNLNELERRGIKHCFHGHTHIQKLYYRHEGRDFEQNDSRNINELSHTLINPGSVGQPRSGNTGVELAIIDFSSQELEFIRLQYKMEILIADMKRGSFPSSLIKRMIIGR